MDEPLNVVLFEPEIPQNTGNIGRLCLAVGARLHLVGPLGFQIDDKRVRRAGLDYWKHLDLIRHENIASFFSELPVDAPKVFLTKNAGNTVYGHRFLPGSYLIFGKETAGIPDYVLNKYAQNTLRIPMFDARVRSLNLSNSVSIVVYEAIRQLLPERVL